MQVARRAQRVTFKIEFGELRSTYVAIPIRSIVQTLECAIYMIEGSLDLLKALVFFATHRSQIYLRAQA
jgi:hypothetical protein